MEHIRDVFLSGADAALAASIFHFGEIKINDLKQYLLTNGVSVRVWNLTIWAVNLMQIFVLAMVRC